MSDLSKRLRGRVHDSQMDNEYMMDDAADELDAKEAIIAELVEALKWSRVGRAPTRLIKGQNDEFWDSWHKTEDLIARASQDKGPTA